MFRTGIATSHFANFAAIVVALPAIAAAQDTKSNISNNQQLRPDMSTPKTVIEGEFDVKMTPVETEDPKLGLMTLQKTYRGKLEGTGSGRMLTGMTDVATSAAYVAMERITATLDGKQGSFIIHHRGIMEGTEQQLEIEIVSDSGTDGLTGIRGTMEIDVRDGKHFYKLNYHFCNSQPEKPPTPSAR